MKMLQTHNDRLTAIVLLSLQGSFLPSTVASLVGVGCLAYDFAPPIHSFRVEDPFSVAAIFTFLTVSAVITRLVASVRKRAQQLALTNATLEAHIASGSRPRKRCSMPGRRSSASLG
jgi:K+-sensing histidine kinase KdpD